MAVFANAQGTDAAACSYKLALASTGYTVIVAYLRGYGTTRFAFAAAIVDVASA